jgi:hypothetical protein
VKSIEKEAPTRHQLHGVNPRRGVQRGDPRQQLGGICAHVADGGDTLG